MNELAKALAPEPAAPARSQIQFSPYRVFSREEWAKLRADTPMTLVPRDLEQLSGLIEELSMEEVEQIYLPMSRLLNLHVAGAQELHTVTSRFLSRRDGRVPYVIGIAGSVAVGRARGDRQDPGHRAGPVRGREAARLAEDGRSRAAPGLHRASRTGRVGANAARRTGPAVQAQLLSLPRPLGKARGPPCGRITAVSDEYSAKISELMARRQKNLAMGGKEKIAKQHGRGKLTVRERLDLLFDKDTFVEFGLLAQQQAVRGGEPDADGTPADGVVTGHGQVDGRQVWVIAYDFTVMAGSMGAVGEQF